MGREALEGLRFLASLPLAGTGQREGGGFSCINKQIISHPVIIIFRGCAYKTLIQLLPLVIINSASSRYANHAAGDDDDLGRHSRGHFRLLEAVEAAQQAASIVIPMPPRLLRSPRGSNDGEERSSLECRLRLCCDCVLSS